MTPLSLTISNQTGQMDMICAFCFVPYRPITSTLTCGQPVDRILIETVSSEILERNE